MAPDMISFDRTRRWLCAGALGLLICTSFGARAEVALAGLDLVPPAAIDITFSRAILDRRTGERALTATVHNLAAGPFLAGSLLLTVEGLLPATVAVGNAAGISTEGTPYYVIQPGYFELGESVDIRLLFADAGRSALDYALNLYHLPPEPQTPIANAGKDRNVIAGGSAMLDGGASYDPDGDPITFSWTVMSRPAGSAASLSDPTSATPEFTLDQAGDYALSLTVNNGIADSPPDTAIITATPHLSPPNADAGPDVPRPLGVAVTLDGHGSDDPNYLPLSYLWSVISVPAESVVADDDLSAPTAPVTTFIPDRLGTYRLLLQVDNGHLGDIDTVEIVVTEMAANEAPYADAGPVQSVAMDEIVMLDGTFSADADVGPESLSYRWAIVSRPAGSAVETYGLTGASTASASFMPDVAGAYIARLEVTDGVASDADHTYVHAGGCENGPDVLASYERVNANGYGDPDNSFSWSATKFKGDLFFGTNRQFTCVEAATLQFFFPDEHFYPDGSPDPAVTCPDDELDLDLRAEIMRFSKVTQTWQRAFQSPNDLPVSGAIDKFAARDIGFRGMTVFEEPDGTEALYVAGVTSRMYLPDLPQPRILRSTDGINFEPLPLPDLEPLLPLDEDDILVGFRSILGFNGRLFVVATSGLRGDGWLLVSDDPTFGHFELVLLPRAATRAYQLVEFNDQLYVGIGSEDEGYEVWRTAAVGDPASFAFTPVVRNGAGRGDHIRSVVAMHPFKGRLYIGANGFHAFPVSAEMIRINPDDSFDIVAGRPRWYEGKYMRPISGFRDGMNNVFNVHFWRMQEHNGILYVGTNDASWRLRTIPWLDPFILFGYGFDLFKTEDGVKWEVVTQNGFGEPFAFGVRTFISDETGLHLARVEPEGVGALV